MCPTLLLAAAFAQDPAALPLLPATPVVEVVATPAMKRADALVIGGRGTFITGLAVMAVGGTIVGAGAARGDMGGAYVLVPGGLITGAIGLAGAVVGGTLWAAGAGEQHRLQVGVAPVGNGFVVTGRF